MCRKKIVNEIKRFAKQEKKKEKKPSLINIIA